jgi:hypothetical protein
VVLLEGHLAAKRMPSTIRSLASFG